MKTNEQYMIQNWEFNLYRVMKVFIINTSLTVDIDLKLLKKLFFASLKDCLNNNFCTKNVNSYYDFTFKFDIYPVEDKRDLNRY